MARLARNTITKCNELTSTAARIACAPVAAGGSIVAVVAKPETVRLFYCSKMLEKGEICQLIAWQFPEPLRDISLEPPNLIALGANSGHIWRLMFPLPTQPREPVESHQTADVLADASAHPSRGSKKRKRATTDSDSTHKHKRHRKDPSSDIPLTPVDATACLPGIVDDVDTDDAARPVLVRPITVKDGRSALLIGYDGGQIGIFSAPPRSSQRDWLPLWLAEDVTSAVPSAVLHVVATPSPLPLRSEQTATTNTTMSTLSTLSRSLFGALFGSDWALTNQRVLLVGDCAGDVHAVALPPQGTAVAMATANGRSPPLPTRLVDRIFQPVHSVLLARIPTARGEPIPSEPNAVVIVGVNGRLVVMTTTCVGDAVMLRTKRLHLPFVDSTEALNTVVSTCVVGGDRLVVCGGGALYVVFLEALFRENSIVRPNHLCVPTWRLPLDRNVWFTAAPNAETDEKPAVVMATEGGRVIALEVPTEGVMALLEGETTAEPTNVKQLLEDIGQVTMETKRLTNENARYNQILKELNNAVHFAAEFTSTRGDTVACHVAIATTSPATVRVTLTNRCRFPLTPHWSVILRVRRVDHTSLTGSFPLHDEVPRGTAWSADMPLANGMLSSLAPLTVSVFLEYCFPELPGNISGVGQHAKKTVTLPLLHTQLDALDMLTSPSLKRVTTVAPSDVSVAMATKRRLGNSMEERIAAMLSTRKSTSTPLSIVPTPAPVLPTVKLAVLLASAAATAEPTSELLSRLVPHLRDVRGKNNFRGELPFDSTVQLAVHKDVDTASRISALSTRPGTPESIPWVPVSITATISASYRAAFPLVRGAMLRRVREMTASQQHPPITAAMVRSLEELLLIVRKYKSKMSRLKEEATELRQVEKALAKGGRGPSWRQRHDAIVALVSALQNLYFELREEIGSVWAAMPC